MNDEISDAAKYERLERNARIEIQTMQLQYRRINGKEPEDEHFHLRVWQDVQFFIISLNRFYKIFKLIDHIQWKDDTLKKAFKTFEQQYRKIKHFRDVGEHFTEYAIENKERHRKYIVRGDLEVGVKPVNCCKFPKMARSEATA